MRGVLWALHKPTEAAETRAPNFTHFFPHILSAFKPWRYIIITPRHHECLEVQDLSKIWEPARIQINQRLHGYCWFWKISFAWLQESIATTLSFRAWWRTRTDSVLRHPETCVVPTRLPTRCLRFSWTLPMWELWKRRPFFVFCRPKITPKIAPKSLARVVHLGGGGGSVAGGFFRTAQISFVPWVWWVASCNLKVTYR